jgi:hypothetical protein
MYVSYELIAEYVQECREKITRIKGPESMFGLQYYSAFNILEYM